MTHHSKPKRFDRNLIVIGAGAAGLVTSYIAAMVKARVTLIEGEKMGGDCLNTGCVPSKSLLNIANQIHNMRHLSRLGLKDIEPMFYFSDVMQRVKETVQAIAPHDSVKRYRALGVECLQGYGSLLSPWEVSVNGRILSARSIVVATGSRPAIPPIPGLANTGFLTSDTIWGLTERPKRLAVLGGGPIGCELSQAFSRLGVEVTQIEMTSRLLFREDQEASARVEQQFKQDGIQVLTNHKVVGVDQYARDKVVICEHAGQRVVVHCDAIMVAVGRSANTDGLGLESLGIKLRANRTIETDEYMRTSCYKHILACGDVAGPYQFTHTAAYQAWYASVNGLFGHIKKFKIDYSVIPWATFTDPEVARVGINQQEADEQNISYEVVTYDLKELDRAIIEGANSGFVKVLTKPGKDRILGVTIVGPHAGELIAEYVLAMKHGIGLNKILGTIHVYPTLSEANKYAAGEWKRAHQPEKLLKWVEKYHRWRCS